jgi:deazaflavin-dependent oxidoreductase (nitroreductase family)
MTDWNAQIIDEYRATGGHPAAFANQPLVLVHMRGARTGNAVVKPLAVLEEDGRLFVFASAGGRPQHPQWYFNLKANPNVEVEHGTDRFPAVATEVTGTERDRIYAAQAAFNPGFADYQSKSTRTIPVFELTRATP